MPNYEQEIQTGERHGLGNLEDWITRVAKRRGKQIVSKMILMEPVLNARMEQGRWLIDCPYCKGASFLFISDLRFMCPDCFNIFYDGAWLPVAIPDNFDEVEAEALAKPISERNWPL